MPEPPQDDIIADLDVISEPDLPAVAKETIELEANAEATLFDTLTQSETLRKFKAKNYRLELQNDELRLRNKQLDNDRNERELYANRIYGVVVGWLDLKLPVSDLVLAPLGRFIPAVQAVQLASDT